MLIDDLLVWQRDIIRALHQFKRVFVMAGRRCGKNYLATYLQEHAGATVYTAFDPKPKEIYIKAPYKHVIRKASDLAVLNEPASMRYEDAVSILEKYDRVLMLGSPVRYKDNKGQVNWYTEMWYRAKLKKSMKLGSMAFRVGIEENDYLDAGEIKRILDNLPPVHAALTRGCPVVSRIDEPDFIRFRSGIRRGVPLRALVELVQDMADRNPELGEKMWAYLCLKIPQTTLHYTLHLRRRGHGR